MNINIVIAIKDCRNFFKKSKTIYSIVNIIKSSGIMNRILAGVLIILAILISGCVSTVDPVNPEDVIVNAGTITMKEFQEMEIPVNILNNGTEPIDSVKVTSFDPFTVVSSGMINIPARTKEGPSSTSINVKIQAPGFKTDTSNSAMVISYASGKNEDGESVLKTKSVPLQTIVLPNAKLQYVGFVKGLANLSEAEVTTMEIGKGQNATITFSVKNDGKTTIDKKSLDVLVDIENKEIGSNSSITIGEGMAKGGTSYTEGVVLPINKDAPNGETDVIVTLYMGTNVIDSRTIHLKVKL